jgi:chromosome segregation ATPase
MVLRAALILVLVEMAAPAHALAADDPAERERRYRLLLFQIASLEASLRAYQQQLPGLRTAVEESRGTYEQASAESAQAGKLLDAARNALRQARRHEASLFRSLKERLETDNAAVAARQRVLTAQQELGRHRERVLAPVRQTESYRAALAAADKARQDLEQRRQKQSLSSSQATAAAKTILELDRAVNALEDQALAADEDYKTTEQELKEARANWSEVQRAIADSIKVDPGRIAAMEAIARAEQEESQAEKDALRARRAATAAKSTYADARGRLYRLEQNIALTERSLALAQRDLQFLTGGGRIIVPYNPLVPAP